jgi:hypothetical protein
MGALLARSDHLSRQIFHAKAAAPTDSPTAGQPPGQDPNALLPRKCPRKIVNNFQFVSRFVMAVTALRSLIA